MKAEVLNKMYQLFLICVITLSKLNAETIDGYLSVGIVSHHFSTDEQGEPFNNDHHAIGAELLLHEHYTLAYLHFDNSRYRSTNIYALGYRYDLYGPFGIYAVAGYQNGYCFDGFKSVECTEGRDDSGFAFLPMLYYKHDYFTLDLIPQNDMIALKLNLKFY